MALEQTLTESLVIFTHSVVQTKIKSILIKTHHFTWVLRHSSLWPKTAMNTEYRRLSATTKDSDGPKIPPHQHKFSLLTPTPFVYLQLMMDQHWGLLCCSILRTDYLKMGIGRCLLAEHCKWLSFHSKNGNMPAEHIQASQSKEVHRISMKFNVTLK